MNNYVTGLRFCCVVLVAVLDCTLSAHTFYTACCKTGCGIVPSAPSRLLRLDSTVLRSIRFWVVPSHAVQAWSPGSICIGCAVQRRCVAGGTIQVCVSILPGVHAVVRSPENAGSRDLVLKTRPRHSEARDCITYRAVAAGTGGFRSGQWHEIMCKRKLLSQVSRYLVKPPAATVLPTPLLLLWPR